MKVSRRQLAQAALFAAPAGAAAQPAALSRVTHGPFLGSVGPNDVWIWGRTERAGALRVRYGTASGRLDQLSDPVATSPDHDNTAWIHLSGLQSNKRYYYQLDGGGPQGTFRTHPSATDFAHPDTNPRGLFNFSFAFGSCANQKTDVELPAYKVLNRQHASKVLFSIMNGDWLYEEKRDYPAGEWRKQVGIEETETPRIVQIAPAVTGVWENYKLYLDRGKPLAEWHRNVPGYFTTDDHEILNDVYGTGSAGVKSREAVFRDISLHAWYDYIAGSTPLATRQGLHFGQATLSGDVLSDAASDFTKLDPSEISNLHIHWGGQRAGVPPGPKADAGEGNPNMGVYSIVSVLDAHRLRITPAPPSGGACSYSIGRHNYSKFRCGNAEVYLLDTRGLRDMHDMQNPGREGLYMLGKKQHEWLKASMAASDADFFFIASSVNLMIPHIGSPGSTDPIAGKDDAWTAFTAEREELIRFWDSLRRPVIVMTGDLHNSWAVKVTDTVWEFAAGPHNSQNHPLVSEGSRPINGKFDSRGRECDIRWSSFIRNDVPPRLRHFPIYAIAQVNNVYPNPDSQGKERWVAYPRPHLVIQYYDGFNGDLLYAEAVHGK
ncbi:MAG TPA: alkaline phosphatase D family protein [Bryobacteraceae bacterium]|nr:alkaline phosphatase D family protein [Bryobacteraceae bacterium]